ncbi:MAG: glutaredoxin family protein [Epsilonproteobacteria bacterium]|nr:glutaredoxin family protein [Campylobacterota bacterium]
MSEIKKQKRVVLFTSPGCHWCVTAKQYLKTNNIKFKNIDINKDTNAAKDCQKHGCKGVPVLLIGSRWICGFDKTKIKKELGL